MPRKNWFAIAAVGVLGFSAFVVGRSWAQSVSTGTVDPYHPTVTTVTRTVTPAARPPVRDPARPPARSPFAP